MGHGQEGTGTPGIYRAVTICRAGIHRVPTILTILLVMMMSIYLAVKKLYAGRAFTGQPLFSAFPLASSLYNIPLSYIFSTPLTDKSY